VNTQASAAPPPPPGIVSPVGTGIARARTWELPRSPAVWLGLVVLGLVALVAVAAPLISPHDPDSVDLARRLLPPFWLADGSTTNVLGTDSLGRDVLSRLIFGSRISLLVGFAAVLIGGTVGVVLGILAGYWGGRVDTVVMTMVDVQMAYPFVLLALAFLTIAGPGVVNVVLVLGIINWVTYARVVRAQVIALRSSQFIESARALGASRSQVVFRHLVPNSLSPIIVLTSFAVARTILSEASLSFLGLGLDPSIPSWGGMTAAGRDYIIQAWWLVTFPGIAIAATVVATNIVGDWIRDQLDPKLRD
jgi:peptide/nickel transport system permease protein